MKKIKKSWLYTITRPIIKFLFILIYRPTMIGCEYIPKSGSIILAGNHTSNFDCLLLMSSTKRPIHFLAKSELFQGLKKIIFANMGLIPVDRSKKNKQAMEAAISYLNVGEVIGIFPEGTTEKGRGQLPFKVGAVKMAECTNTKIVPFVIKGHYKPFKNDLKIIFLKPITIKDDIEVENERLMKLIKKTSEED